MQQRRNTSWHVTGWSRPDPHAPEPPPGTTTTVQVTDEHGEPWVLSRPHEVPTIEGASITDKGSGITYRATIAQRSGRPFLTFLSIDPPERGSIDARVYSGVRIDQIVKAVQDYLKAVREADGRPVVLMDYVPKGDAPELSEVAEVYNENGGRAAVLHEFEGLASTATIDRWIRLARDEGLIEPARTGRPTNNEGKDQQ